MIILYRTIYYYCISVVLNLWVTFLWRFAKIRMLPTVFFVLAFLRWYMQGISKGYVMVDRRKRVGNSCLYLIDWNVNVQMFLRARHRVVLPLSSFLLSWNIANYFLGSTKHILFDFWFVCHLYSWRVHVKAQKLF